ncbi:hypothetical protein [Amycolatopsis magusensis]|uniref:HNH endonuclease n=1 Tax=Amycolatopsis magusensis TaxID=882444 RepID=A0ABS4PYC6_9PSEU|nr:hypothetical protein [Amycolatopsis magusensis]MBP2183834.1 hypothetical protein [Amycolatopsis magusensis]
MDIAHIHAEDPNGPRHIKLPKDRYDAFSNLILLCRFHHTKVDNKATLHLYPAKDLAAWKVSCEKNLRDKINGLDNLTEERLGILLDKAAKSTIPEIEGAIGSLRDVSNGAAEILQTMLNKIETHYLDAESIATLDAASHRLGDLEANAAVLSAAAYRLGDLEVNAAILNVASERLQHLESNAAALAAATSQCEQLNLNSTPRWFEEFKYEYNMTINSIPDASEVVATIQRAGERAIAQLNQEAASIDIGEPPIMLDHPQRWKFFAAGIIVAFALVIIGIVLRTTGTI